jgi:hypothetical protein
VTMGALFAGAAIWVAEVAVMTSDGFSGNVRYLIMPAATLWVLAGVGAGRLLQIALGRRATRGAVAVACTVLLGAAFAAPAVDRVPHDIDAVFVQARLNDALGRAVPHSGGAARLLACGDPYTGPFQVPVVAWHLRVHTSTVALVPHRPAVVFRVGSQPPSRVRPSLRTLGNQSDVRTLGAAGGWRIVGACRGGSA